MSAGLDIRYWRGEALPAALHALQIEARREGFTYLDRIEAECFGPEAIFSPAPARLAFAWLNGILAGIGGMTRDPYDPASHRLRMRHFYVHPAYRRTGTARQLAEHLIANTDPTIVYLTLRAPFTQARTFWESNGFNAVEHPNRTHERFLAIPGA